MGDNEDGINNGSSSGMGPGVMNVDLPKLSVAVPAPTTAASATAVSVEGMFTRIAIVLLTQRGKCNAAWTFPVPCVPCHQRIFSYFHYIYIYAPANDSYKPMHLPYLVIDILSRDKSCTTTNM